VAAAVTVLCRSLIRGIGLESALQRSAEGKQAQTSEALFSSKDGPGNNGGFAPDVLRLAVYFVCMSGSFAVALERSLAFAGPANYCPVLVGAIAGARWGALAIAPTSLAHVYIMPRVGPAAEALANGWVEGAL
jgi:ADP-ribosylglycohydrolase